MKIEGEVERIKGDFSGRKIPRVKCPEVKRKVSVSCCSPYSCSNAGKVYIDWNKGICAVECEYKENK